jgi:GMP synthase (glutamine-hydrolysing)
MGKRAVSSGLVSTKPIVLVIQHEDDAPLGFLGEWLSDAAVAVEVIKPYLGQKVPANLQGYSGLIVLGGAMGVYDEADYPWLVEAKALLRIAAQEQVPTLGVCLGGQLLADATGGRVERSDNAEIGVCSISLLEDAQEDELLSKVSNVGIPVLVPQYHQDAIVELPEDAILLASSDDCRVQAFRIGANVWGVQFHPETDKEIMADWLNSLDPARKGVNITNQEVMHDYQQYGETMKENWSGLGKAFAEVVKTYRK